MKTFEEHWTRKEEAVALVIVLAFLVLVTGLVVAYFSRTTTERSVAQASFNDSAADQLAQSALNIVVGDMRQEIVNGAVIGSANIGPQRSPAPTSAATPAIPNLIRRSVSPDGITAPAVASRASAINSTAPSLNGRSVSLARWNSHYLVPKANTGDANSDPITTGFTAPNYWAPDWVIVTRAGPATFTGWDANLADAISTNTFYAVGRYAYAIYDEGGTLDANVAGYPYPSPSPAVTPPALIANIGRKGMIAFADLTAMRITPSGSTPSESAVTKFVSWRNYATLKASGTFPNLYCPDPTAQDFVDYVLLDRSRDFQSVAQTLYNGRTDQAFVDRRELIELVRGASLSFNMLQFLGTFSRELNKPTWGTAPTTLAGRFPLERFDLFKATPPGTNAANIQKYFGLQYVPAGPGVAEHWDYVGTSGAIPPIRQQTIPSVSGTNQDPNFFSLLKFALPASSSIGELLSIGASLIDQRDTNDETTWIEFGDPSLPAQKAYGADKNAAPSPAPRPATVVVLNRAFRNVGELGYAYRNAATNLDFQTAGSTDAPLLDLFTFNEATRRAGIVNLNTQNSAVIAAILKGAFPTEVSTTGVTTAQATPAALNITKVTATLPAIGRQDITRLATAPTNTPFSSGTEQRRTVARALAEVTQTRTWGLLIDVVAQTGRYPRTASSLADFVVEGEKRYWLHIAIDRLTNEVIDQQLEAVYE